MTLDTAATAPSASSPLILALGDPKAAAYASQMHAIENLGRLTFRKEHSFDDVNAVIDFVFEECFDAVLMPNPYGNERRKYVYLRCRELGIPTVVFDRGGLPGTWFFDVGFNADSPSYFPSTWDRNLSSDEVARVGSYIHDLVHSDKSLESQGGRRGGDQLRQTLGLEGKRVLFAPFQRPDDTTIKHFSGAVSSVAEFAKRLEELAERLAVESPDWVIICKQHPLETTSLPNTLLAAPPSTHVNDLLELCEAVCLVNSGVGLLATLYNKPVYYFGRTYYGHPRLNRHVQSAEDVLVGLTRCPVDFDPAVRDRLIFHLTERVYSHAHFHTELVEERGGSHRNVTRHIEFRTLRFPPVPANSETALRKPRVLFVTPVIPVPNNRGSAVRTDQMIRALKTAGCRVDLAVLNRSEGKVSSRGITSRLQLAYPGTQTYVRKHPSFLRSAKKLKLRLRYAKFWLAKALDRLRTKAWMIQHEDECPSKFRDLVDSLLSTGKYDIAFYNYLKVSCSLDRPGVYKIADLHDIQTHRVTNDIAPSWPEPIRPSMIKRFAASERAMMEKLDALVAITDVECAQVLRDFVPNKQVHLIPITIPKEPVQESEGGDLDVVFIGSNSVPNGRSMVWFLEDIWPLVTAQLPGAKLSVLGNICRNQDIARTLQTYSEDARQTVRLRGFARNLRAAYGRARVVVSPTTHGTGMKVKVIEALKEGKAVVGTQVAFEGIAAETGHHAMIADDPEQFAEHIVTLLGDPVLRRRLESASLQLYERDHSFERAVAGVQEILAARPKTQC